MSHSPLPATVVLQRWRSVHDIDETTRVIGLDPRDALVVGDLAPALADLVVELRRPVTPAEFAARAGARGVPPADAHALLRALHDAGELVDGSATARIAAHRAAAAVVVHGNGPLTCGIVVGLAAGGVETLHVVATGEVAGADLGTGLVDADRGCDRAAAIAAAAARLVPGTTLPPRPRNLVPDLVVLADEHPDPMHCADLVAGRVAHLPVRMRDGIGVVGPLVLPGRTACLGCLDLQRSAYDSSWPRVAAQLAGRRGGADPACVTATVGLAVAQALAAVDATAGGTPAPSALEASLEIDIATATIARRPWQAVRGCPCRAADLTRTGSGAGSTIEG
ncbi:TOMM precursor leader peptide-binding protein [Pseudonocardia sp. CA-107938]|uniref:TOMM precursor leader peptide-binding protein n=1 Tax=Pseudonocardia sp. CA-107938 TaxID=3240021 RepID=UPI003D8B116D